jgi:AcrR family transcriptional regulator
MARTRAGAAPPPEAPTPAGGREVGSRAPRRDRRANRESLLVAAAHVVRDRGRAVPLAEVATAAGVGIGTLYRHFPDREELLAALAQRSYDLVLELARTAAAADLAPVAALHRFLDQVIDHRAELVLPLVGGPGSFENSDPRRREEIVAALTRVIEKGVADGSLRPDAAATDIVLAGALLAQPATPTLDWDRVARRHLAIYLDGLRAPLDGAGPGRAQPLSRTELEEEMTAGASEGPRRDSADVSNEAGGRSSSR